MRKSFWTSSIGKKFLVAATGLILFGFVIAHMLGNLQVFLGPKALNDYAEHLAALPVLLWPARVILLTSILVHIVLACQLAVENRRARPVPYAAGRKAVASTFASRTMVYTGCAVFFFIVYHLLHFTFGSVHGQYHGFQDAQGRHDVYSMVVASFRQPLIAGSYLAAMAFLCLHLSHGAQSLFQSLGFNDERLKPFYTLAARAVAVLIFIGNSSIVAASFFGLLKLPGRPL